VPFNKPATYNFLLVFHCNYAFILYLFRHTMSYSQVKTSRDPNNIPFGRAALMGSTLITRQRSFAEYWKYFVACFNDVHALGYNFAASERIWMKFGELQVYCLELALTDFGCGPCRSESGRPCGSFVFFCQVNNARLCCFPVSQISRNLHTRCDVIL